jgi:hypothetical protein
LVYIGSTCEKRLSTRLSHHVAHYKKNLNEKYSYTSSYEIIKNGNYEICLIENYPCDNSDELRMRERFYKESNECVNIVNPIRLIEDEKNSGKKYYEENKEAIKLSHKRYYEENREKMHIHSKKYREENREKEKFRKQKFREENREMIKLRNQIYYEENKEKVNLRSKIYREENKEKEKLRLKKYTEENREKQSLRLKKYYEDNKETVNFKQREKRRIQNLYLEQLKYYNL